MGSLIIKLFTVYLSNNMDSKATIFEFTSYIFEPDKKRILFNYKTEFNGREPLFFTETIILPKTPNLDFIPKGLVNKLLESLHIVLGISYYKFYCATKVKLPYHLSKKEADFWNIVYRKGLGEFFYRNNLNPNISPTFPFDKNIKFTNYKLQTTNSRCLVGIGGGKDSIVTAEILKENDFDITAFTVETGKETELINNVIKTIGIKGLKIQRFLDQQVYQKHQYNGHVPISAVYAFLGIFSAILYQYKYFIVSNEHSSNFGNLNYKGEIINHQWSKSFEFESLFKEYIDNVTSKDVSYFSFLRPFYEIRIVKMFSKLKKYFPLFSSCNNNFKINNQNTSLWCGQCAKCIFVFTLLSAYLSKKELLDIFKKNLYQDENLLSLFKDVLGFGNIKPFDCVGTFQEAETSLFLAKDKFKNDFIVRQLGKKVKYHKEVFKTNKDNNIPEEFKLLGMESVLIAGFGKEGEVTKKYLKKYYPKIKMGIADAKEGRDYLKKQSDFDIAIKTPGIKKELITIPYTTATNIFFSKVLGKNIIIGVTGSKGKSTTSSLIYHILKTAGKNVELLGNIGKPMLESLLKTVKKDTIFVLELSSYQLDDIKFSPDIAVVTNLFNEHMDYHGNVKNYWQAKKNIINFQNIENSFIYNPKDKEQLKWLKDYKGKAIPFSTKTLKSNLIGQHNENNIKAAVAVAETLGIPEEKIQKAINSFNALPHRLETVGTFKGITFINDANAAIPEATIMAIQSIPNIGTIFLGGQDRGYHFTQLEKTIKKYKIKNVVLFPESGSRILKSKNGFNILKTSSMKEAVAFAYKNTKKGSVCLLSCASPSYSLWKNFEEKGDEFKKFVKELAKR